MDWMHLLFFGAACAGVGFAYGYRGQRDIHRDQVSYLRRQLGGDYRADPPPKEPKTSAITAWKGNG